MPESLFSGLVAVRSFLSLIGTAAELLSQPFIIVGLANLSKIAPARQFHL
jgi:hypothetical protein